MRHKILFILAVIIALSFNVEAQKQKKTTEK